MDRKATARWQGGLKQGKGTVSSESGALSEMQYSFKSRFEQGTGTNPEELLAAAHAGCFTMKLAAELEAAGMVPQELNTTATITLSMEAGGPKITKSQLETVANVPGADKTKFDAAVKAAEQGCPVSRVLNAQVLVSVRLA